MRRYRLTIDPYGGKCCEMNGGELEGRSSRHQCSHESISPQVITQSNKDINVPLRASERQDTTLDPTIGDSKAMGYPNRDKTERKTQQKRSLNPKESEQKVELSPRDARTW